MGFEEIFFQPYTKEDLRRILMGRSAEAFNEGVVDEKVLQECVEYASEQSRDVRRMVDLLRVCGEMAEADHSERVEMKHFTQASERFKQDHYKALFAGLAGLQLDLLHNLAELDVFEGVTAPSTSQLYLKCEHLHKFCSSYRRVASVLKELEVMNLVGGRSISKGRGGRTNEVWLKIPADTILDYTLPNWRELM